MMLEHQVTIFLLRNVRTLLVTHSLECLPSSTQVSSVHKTDVQSSYVQLR
ncbi:Bgt-50526 [Blumeria graminis f. sp. tritici]|uniref:Bgt-50526 n=1 Tax=Blumeria graminis f. sp. tritici TaxID=62690 RepID=A0A9X9MMI3_BLUGR|nr:Bgt-50526 [Blumeria graminis f. sp. tritici]